MFSSPDIVTGVSDAVGAYLRARNRVPAGRVRVIYNGVDVDRFSAPYDRIAKRRKIGIPSEAWVVGLVASLRPQKNHPLLLHAFERVLPDVPEARLVLVGDGEMRAPLEALADHLKIRERVHFLGSRLDAHELFSTFNVYCLPSRYEGMPLTVFEAMAAGKPVVATRVIGIQEVVADGQTGLLVPPDDPDALARALLRIWADPALGGRLAEAGWNYVNQHARLKDMVDRYAALYEELLTA
jgi:glycosyltransferase involved in cell wall biosynthesis